jgi:hypothetical protein
MNSELMDGAAVREGARAEKGAGRTGRFPPKLIAEMDQVAGWKSASGEV